MAELATIPQGWKLAEDPVPVEPAPIPEGWKIVEDSLRPDETTLEYKQRTAIYRGVDPSRERPTASASARDAAILKDRLIASADPAKVQAYTKIAETLSRTPPLTIGEHTAASQIPPEDRELFAEIASRQYRADQSMKKAGFGAQLATSTVQGAITDFGMPLAKAAGVVPGLDPEQERFKQTLMGIREGVDPTMRPETGIIGKTAQQVSRMAFPAGMAIGAGKGGAAAASALGLGKKGVGIAAGVATSGSVLPQIANQTYTSLIGEKVPPGRAMAITAISAPIEAAIESILPDPFSGYGAAFRGTVRQVVGRLIKRYGINTTKELVEEDLQAIGNATAMEVGRMMDEEIPNQGFTEILASGGEAFIDSALAIAAFTAPGAVVGTAQVARESASRPGRLSFLKEIRAKGPVSRTDGRELGLSPEDAKSQETRTAAVDKQIKELEQEIQDASTVPSTTPEVRKAEGGKTVRGTGKEQEVTKPEGEVTPAPEVSVEAGYRHSGTPEHKAYSEQGGWKLHLAVAPENYAAVDEWLDKNYPGVYKHLSGGEAGEADFTAYVGDVKASRELAQKIESEIGDKLLKPTKPGNMPFGAKVSGRFDVQATKQGGEQELIYYGSEGIPYDRQAADTRQQLMFAKRKGDAEKVAYWERELAKDERRIRQKLKDLYGERFETPAQEVQAPVGPVTPAPEVQVEETAPTETPEQLARRAARGEDVARPEGISQARWVAMVDQMRRRIGLKPKPAPAAPTTPQEAPQPAPDVEPGVLEPAAGAPVTEAEEAVSEPPTTPEGTTGTKNVKTDELRARRGLGERVYGDAESVEQWQAEGARRIAEDPSYPGRLAAELAENPRRIDPPEEAALQQHIRQLENELLAGDEFVRGDLLTAIEAAEKVGKKWGQTGVSRQTELKEDFSVAGIARQHIRAVDEKPTDEQMAKYEEMADRIKQLEAERDELQQQAAKAEVEDRIEKAKGKKPRRPTPGTKKATLQRKASQAVEDFKKEWSTLFELGAVSDPKRDAEKWARIVKAAGKVIQAYGELGVNSLLEMTARLRQEGATDDQVSAVEEAWGSAKVEPPLSETSESSEIGKVARDLTRWAVESGIEGREDVIDAVHKAIQDMGVEISRSDTMQAMSGYGEFRELAKDEVSVKVRGIKGEIQQLKKLEDMQAGRAPKKTGVERREPTEEERRLIKEVNEAKKRGGYEVTDPEKQLKSALDTAKKAANNRLKDLDAEIKELEDSIAARTPRKGRGERTPPPSDTELDELRKQATKRREQRDKLKAEYEKIFPPTKQQRIRTAEQQTQAALKEIEKLQKQLKDVREGKETKREGQPNLIPEDIQKRLKEWRERLKAAKKAAKEAELARFEGEGGALAPSKGKKPLTDAQRLKMANKMLDRQISELKGDLAAGRLGQKERRAPVTSAERQAKEQELGRLKGLREDARKADPEYQAQETARQNARYKKALQRQMEFWEKRLAEAKQGKLPPKRVTKTPVDREILEKKTDIAEVKKEATREIARVKREQRPDIQKAAELVPEALNASRAILTSFDLSAVLRQGGVLSAAHPMLSSEAFVPMLNAFASERGQATATEMIKELDSAEMAQKAGLEITTDEASLSAMEEAYMSRLAEKIPGVSHSARAYMTFLNVQRALVFDSLVSKLGRKGKVTEQEAKVIANWVNVASGRGNLGRAQAAATALATAFFAPRYVVSRFQLLLGQPLWTGVLKGEGGARARLLVAQEYGRAAGSLALFYGTFATMAAMLWDPDDEDKPTVTFDNRSSDFGKLKFGETRVDPLAGLAQVTTLLGRLWHGETVNQKGEVKALAGEEKEFFGRGVFEVMSDFVRTKLSPALGTAIDIKAKENVVGEEVTLVSGLVDLGKPLIVEDVTEALQAQGIPAGTALGILAVLGMSSQTYGEYTSYQQANKTERKEMFSKLLDNAEWDSTQPAYSELLSTKQVKQVDESIEKAKQNVVYAGMARDNISRSGYQSDKSYLKAGAQRRKAKKTFREMSTALNLTYEDAQKFLLDYQRSHYKSDSTEGYTSRANALNKLYGKSKGDWRTWYDAQPRRQRRIPR